MIPAQTARAAILWATFTSLKYGPSRKFFARDRAEVDVLAEMMRLTLRVVGQTLLSAEVGAALEPNMSEADIDALMRPKRAIV